MSRWRHFVTRLRGGLSLVVAAAAILAVYEATPLGPLGRLALNAIRGTKAPGPSPLAAFTDASGRTYGFLLPADERTVTSLFAAAECLPSQTLEETARAQEVDPSNLAALVGALAETSDGACRLRMPSRLESRAVEVLPRGTSRNDVRSDPGLATRGLARLLAVEQRAFADRVRSAELSLEALLLGHDAVADAIAAAEAAGIDDPEHLESHRGLLPAGAADRADQARAVLARARLGHLLWPVEVSFPITSPFGERMHPVLREKRFHNGVDVAVPSGTPLRSVLGGSVTRVGFDNVSGHYIRVDHDYGIEAVFCHLTRAEAAASSRVERGDVIARSGNTGRSTGPHLHFTLRLFGRPIDPAALVGRAPPPRVALYSGASVP